MPVYRNRVCTVCGDVKFTACKTDVCLKCASEIRYAKGKDKLKSDLEAVGHSDIEFTGFNHYNKVSVTFTHLSCGTRQTWAKSNVISRLEQDPHTAPCSKCGGLRRMKVALDAYVVKYGLSPERQQEWEGYRSLVRRLSDATYRKFKAEINPLNLKRSMKDFHLDHKLPIIEGFVQGLEPSVIAAKENLQMLTATVNLTKGRRSS